MELVDGKGPVVVVSATTSLAVVTAPKYSSIPLELLVGSSDIRVVDTDLIAMGEGVDGTVHYRITGWTGREFTLLRVYPR